MPSVPLIDISPLTGASNATLSQVGQQLCEAAEHMGFFYVRGHGIEDHIIDSAFQVAHHFFLRPEAEKNQVRVAETHRGFLSIGESTMEGYQGADRKESFYLGI